jgi:flagellar hook-basal body complex protein FliE
MDITLGRALPAGIGDYATGLANQLRDNLPTRSGQPGAAEAAGGIESSVLSAALSGAKGPQSSALPATGGAGSVAESFSQLLSQAMQDVNQVHQAADADANRLVSGEPVDIHQVMIGMEKANVAFGLTLQVRNKLVEAYQEIMRMQV